jgi:hypothetical protein
MVLSGQFIPGMEVQNHHVLVVDSREMYAPVLHILLGVDPVFELL